MAVTRVNQGEIVEVPFELPDGSITIPIEDSWLNKPLSKSSFFVTHIIDQFNVDEVMRRNNTYLKARYFDYVVDEIIKNVIGGKDE